MFAVVQFPLTDIRPFLDVATQRLAAPTWPIVHLPDEPYKVPFVRGFGRARKRQSGGVEDWPAENAYCDVAHALRFVTSVFKYSPDIAALVPRRYCAFRRLFWDGQLAAEGSVVGRIEIGFGLRLGGSRPLTGPELGSTIDALLRQQVRIAPRLTAPAAPGAPMSAPIILSHAGSNLAKAYLRASTGAALDGGIKGHEWWLQAGSPLLIVEYVRDQEVESLPAQTVPVALQGNTVAGLRVFLGRRTLEGRERPIWFFECDPAGVDRDALRRLRLNVTRLHAVLASLRILSDLQLKKRVAPTTPLAKKNLQDCLGRFLPFLYQQEYLGFQWSGFLRAALSLSETLTPNEFATLRALHPAAGRGLAAQLDLASTAVDKHQPQPLPAVQWDVFIAHAGGDSAIAEALYDLLKDKSRVFLDVRCVHLGDDWDLKLREAQRHAYMTVVLVGATADTAYYLRSEIAAAISLARLDDQRYRVVPLYLEGAAGRSVAQPYGLNLKHGLELDGTADLPQAAQRILETLAATQPAGAALAGATPHG